MPVKKIEKEGFLLRCWEVFHLNGYYNTSMQDLAAATGLQKAGLYHHYPTKQILMENVLAFALDHFRKRVLAVAAEDNLPWDQRLEKLLRRQKNLALLHRQGCFFANIALETGREGLFNELIQTAFREWAETLSVVLAHFMPEDKAAEQAQRLIMEYEGAVLYYKITGEAQYLEHFVQRAVGSVRSTHVAVSVS